MRRCWSGLRVRTLALLESIEHLARTRHEESAARTVRCDRCGGYYDTKNEWHGDGKGNRCPVREDVSDKITFKGEDR
jgi:hypothetical protein